jgi:hypothetical protein
MPVEGRDDEVVPVTFLTQHASYFAGETASFLPEDATALIEQGVAESGSSTGLTSATLTGATLDPVALVTALQVIADGGFAITIDGAPREVGPIDFTGVAGAPEAASLITAALGGAAVCAWIASNCFTIATTATGLAATLDFASAPASGTDVSTICGLTEASGATLAQGTAP